MSEISIYDIVPTPKLADKLIGTSVGGVIEDVTYNFTLQELLQLFIPNLPANNLQGVLDYGNTATQNINLIGTISTTNLTVLATANILNSNLSGNTRVMAGLFDRTNASGTAGQFLRSTGTQVEWFTIPTVIPTLQQVLQSGNTSNISIILTANITAVTATADTVVSNTSLNVNGVLRDGVSAVGASNQILSSTGSGVRWVDMPVYNVISPLLYDTPTKTFSIQVASSSQSGYLSSADWINFDGKQNAIILTTTGTSGASTFVGNTLNIPVYSPDLSGYVPTSRTLTINGTTYDLSANRSWTLATGVAEVTATSPLFSSGGAYPDITIQKADSALNGYLSNTDWLTFNSKQSALTFSAPLVNTAGVISIPAATTSINGYLSAADWAIFNAKQAALNGTGFVKIVGTTISYDNSTYYLASNPSAFIALTALSAGAGISYNNTTGVIASTITQYTDALARASISLTTTGTSGAATYNNTTGVFNIPQYTDQFVGTVTSVAALTIGTAGTDLSSTVANSTTTPVITLNVPTASATNRGALSSADWTTFNAKQVAGDYITSLTGEATGVGPGATAVTLNNASVTGKVLTGVNITGGTVLATDTMLTAFGKLQNQINGLIGSTIYQGVWNANTNTPTLTSSVGTNGFYYIVNVAGATNLNGITDWKVGDWAIFNGGVWQKVDNTESVTSVNGFTGAVSLTTDNVAEGTTNLYFSDARARSAISLTVIGSSGASAYNNTTGVLNVPTYTLSGLGGQPLATNLTSLSGLTFASTSFVKMTAAGTFALDTNVYLTTAAAASTYLPLAGGTLTGALGGTTASFSGAVSTNAPSGGATGEGLVVGQSFKIDGSGTTQRAVMYVVSNVLSNTYGSGLQIQGANLADDKGFGFNLNTTGGFEIYVKNTSYNKALTIANTNAATFTNTVTATSLIKTGGTSAQFLKADGSVDSNTYGTGTVTSVAALTIGTTGTDLSSTVATGTTTPVITLNVPTASAANRGALSAADWTTFNNKASTASLANYLPLAGGTLSGALSGTSATFSGALEAGKAGGAVTSGDLLIDPTSLSANVYVGRLSSTSNDNTNFIVRNRIGTELFKVTGNTGAATFSSSVTAGGKLTIAGGGTNNILVSENNGAVTIPTNGLSINTGYGVGYIENRNGGNYADLYYSASKHLFTAGNVGIGTTSPTDRLDISGVLRVVMPNDPLTGAVTAKILSFAPNPFGLVFRGYETGTHSIQSQRENNNAQLYGLSLQPLGGNVMIGTTTDAGYKLDVNGTGRFTTNVNIGTYLSLGTGSGKFLAVGGAVTAGSSADILMYNTGGNLIFWATGAVGLSIAATSGAATFSGTIDAASNIRTDGGTVQVGAGAGSYYTRLATVYNYPYVDSFLDSMAGSSYDGRLTFRIQRNGGSVSAMMTIFPTGNVLIGTTTDATGKLQVNGSVYATSFFESSSVAFKNILATNPLTSLNVDVIKYKRTNVDVDDVRYGYSAEQINSLMPELTNKEATAVKYLDVHTLLIAELQREIKELKARLN
jgi:hypothetical protein